MPQTTQAGVAALKTMSCASQGSSESLVRRVMKPDSHVESGAAQSLTLQTECKSTVHSYNAV